MQLTEMVSSWFVGWVGDNPFFVANPSGTHAIACFWHHRQRMRRLWERSQRDKSVSSRLYKDTGASSRLNFRKPVDDQEEDLQLAIFPTGTTVVPQKVYQPRGETERQKYVHTAILSSPIFFYAEKPSELGISLEEILEQNSRRLSDRDDLVFEGGGRSISLRIEWPGYLSWNCQLPTRDYRKTPGPITKARLAKNLATCIRKFVRVRLHVSSFSPHGGRR